MKQEFLQTFLKISDIRTVLFLVVLVGLFFVMHVLYRKKKMGFSKVVIIGTGMGLALGFCIQLVGGFPEDPSNVTWIQEISNWYQLFGTGFLYLIRMIVIPLVLASICNVIIHLEQGTIRISIVKYTIVITLFMVTISAMIGILVGVVLQVGVGEQVIVEQKQLEKKLHLWHLPYYI